MRRMYSLNQLKEIANVQVQQQVSSGNLQNVKVFENIVDKDGHKRFIEGNISLSSQAPEGTSKIYGKWSLSGTHLMIVICVGLVNGTSYTDNLGVASMTLPSWVASKIATIVGVSIDYKTFNAYASNYTKQDFRVRLQKGDNTLGIVKEGTLTLTTDRIVRIEFDLLIDNE